MPDLILDSTLWRYSTDLDFAPVGRWSASFVEQDGPSNITERIFTLAAKADTASIRAVVDGHQITIVDHGIVDSYEVNEDPDAVTALVEGRDNKARWLDAYPIEPKTYRGLYTTTDSPRSLCAGGGEPTVTLNYPTTFHQAVTDIAGRMGLTLIIDSDVYNYTLGQDFVHDTTESYMQALAGLAEPLRQAGRGRVDFIVNGNFLIMKTRTLAISAGLTVPYEDVVIRNVTKTRRPNINDVQVLGAAYQIFVREDSQEARTESRTIQATIQAFVAPFFPPPEDGSDISTPTGVLLWQETETKVFDTRGKHISTAARKSHYYGTVSNEQGQVIAFPRYRTEDTSENIIYGGPKCEMTSRSKRVFVNEDTIKPDPEYPTSSYNNSSTNRLWTYIKQEMEREVTVVVYRREPGLSSQTFYDPAYSITELYRAAEPKDIELAPGEGRDIARIADPDEPGGKYTSLNLEHHEVLDFIQSGNQLIRVLRSMDVAEDGQITMSTATEPATGSLNSPGDRFGFSSESGEFEEGDGGAPAPPGFTTEQIQIKAGPDNANIKLSIPLLGTAADCEFVRQQVLVWYQSWDHNVDMEFPPYLSIAPGITVEITNAPARWELTKFYLPSYTIERNPDSMTIQTRGVAWSTLS